VLARVLAHMGVAHDLGKRWGHDIKMNATKES
jgi:hypothetical protein